MLCVVGLTRTQELYGVDAAVAICMYCTSTACVCRRTAATAACCCCKYMYNESMYKYADPVVASRGPI